MTRVHVHSRNNDSNRRVPTHATRIHRLIPMNKPSIHTLVQDFETAQASRQLPDFGPGDTVIVNVKVKEGNRERVQAYEGVDERLLQAEVDEELSIGDYVLSGGELAAAVVVDAVARLLDGALGDAESAVQDSFEGDGLLDCPHYTRPEVYEGLSVPDVLLSGHHENIRRWRLKQSLQRTRERRPELFAKWLAQRADRAGGLSKEEAQLLRELDVQKLCGREK